jgi:hypothetical protein
MISKSYVNETAYENKQVLGIAIPVLLVLVYMYDFQGLRVAFSNGPNKLRCMASPDDESRASFRNFMCF